MSSEPAMRDHIVLPPVHPSPSNVDGGQDSLGNHKSRVSDGQLRDIVETESAGLQISDNTCSSGELGDTEEPGHNATQGEEILPVVSTTLPGVSARANSHPMVTRSKLGLRGTVSVKSFFPWVVYLEVVQVTGLEFLLNGF
ncbi:hypothetical protein V6N11_077964 [Hibiscus sabdariffa]|uniref:Uncharacterized protein n=1 Tax=Hibiscus sabdariffa TaxID=183260 RepID=A0ABR2TEL8_9ROSI